MDEGEVLRTLRQLSNPANVAGMVRFGISPKNNLGITIVALRAYAKKIGTDHTLAVQLWKSGIHDARLFASMIDDPEQVTERQMDTWAQGFDSWDICDQCCNNLFQKTPFAHKKAHEWSTQEQEFVKRAGFTPIAVLAVHDKKANDRQFLAFFPLIKKGSTDNRNYVKKAVNWALRQIGKRNTSLHTNALNLAYELKQIDSPAARWIAADAIRELTSEKIRQSLNAKMKKTKKKKTMP